MEPTFLGTCGHPVPTARTRKCADCKRADTTRRQQRKRGHVAAASHVDDIVWDAFIAAEVLAPEEITPGMIFPPVRVLPGVGQSRQAEAFAAWETDNPAAVRILAPGWADVAHERAGTLDPNDPRRLPRITRLSHNDQRTGPDGPLHGLSDILAGLEHTTAHTPHRATDAGADDEESPGYLVESFGKVGREDNRAPISYVDTDVPIRADYDATRALIKRAEVTPAARIATETSIAKWRARVARERADGHDKIHSDPLVDLVARSIMDAERKPGRQALKEATRRVAAAGPRAVTFRVKSARLDVPRDADGLPLTREHRIAEAMREAHERASSARLDIASPARRGLSAWLADCRAARRIRDAEATAAEVVEWVDGLGNERAARRDMQGRRLAANQPSVYMPAGAASAGPHSALTGVYVEDATLPARVTAGTDSVTVEIDGVRRLVPPREAVLDLSPWWTLPLDKAADRVRSEPYARWLREAKREAKFTAGPFKVDDRADDRLLAAYAAGSARLSHVTPAARRRLAGLPPTGVLEPTADGKRSRLDRPGRHRVVAYGAGLRRSVPDPRGTATPAALVVGCDGLRRVAVRPRPTIHAGHHVPRVIPAAAYDPGPVELALRPVPMADAPQWYVSGESLRRVPARPLPEGARLVRGSRPDRHRLEYKAPEVVDPEWLAFVRSIRRPSDVDWSEGPPLARCTCERTSAHLVQRHRWLLPIVPRTPRPAPVYPSVPAQPCACCGLTACKIRRGVRPAYPPRLSGAVRRSATVSAD